MDRSPAIEIRASIEDARRQLRLRGFISAAIGTIGLVLVTVICVRGLSLYFGIDLHFPHWALTTFLLSLVGLGWLTSITVRRTQSDRVVTALWRKSSDPALEELLLSALELGAHQAEATTTDTTRQLIEQQLHYVLKRLRSADIRAMFPRRLDTRGQIFVSVVVCMLLATFAKSGFWSSETPSEVIKLRKSWVKGLTLTVVPPPYTKLKSKVYENTDGHLTALIGSKVAVTGYVDLAKDHQIRVGLPGKSPIALDVASKTIGFDFEITQSGAWYFELYNSELDTVLKETSSRHITATADKAPRVVLTKPKQDQTVSATALMQLVYNATDDFQLAKSSLVVALDGDLEHAERIELNQLLTKKTHGAEELDLSLFDIQGGDRVAVYIECSDTKQPSPQVGRSKALYLTIESAEDEHQALTMKLKALIEPFLTDLADRLEFDVRKQSAEMLSALHARATKTASNASSIIESLANDPLTPQAVRALLESTLTLLHDALLTESKTLMAWREKPKAGIVFSIQAFEPIIGHTEAMVIALEAAVARLSLEDMKALTEQIRVRRERIQDLLRSYKSKPDQDLKNRILRNIKRLKQKMEQLREKLAQLRQKLPEEFLNLEGLKGSELSETMAEGEQKLDDLEKMLEEGRIEEAMKALDDLSESLDAFDQLVNKDMDTLHREGDPKRQQAISELMDKTRELMKSQRALLEKTRATAKKGQDAFDQVMKEQDGRPLDEIAADLVQTERHINALREQKRPARRQERLRKLAEQTGAVLDALERENLPRAIENIEQALESSRRMTWDRTGPDHKADRAINKSLRHAQESMKKLLSKARNAQKRAQDSAQTKALSKAQQKLKAKLDQLNQEMGDKGQEIPGLEGKPAQSLKQAGASMNKAGQSLERSQPNQAPPSQVEAMNALDQTMQNLRQAAKPKPTQRNGQARSRQEKVEIPSGEDYAAPSAFREELLKAMKRKTDDSNQDAVKRYYRSLVE